MLTRILSSLTLLLAIGALAIAQDRVVAQPYTAGYGITETVAELQARQALLPPDSGPFLTNEENESGPPLRHILGFPGSSYPPNAEANANNDGIGPFFGTVSGSISGVTQSEGGWIPPDSNGDVGPTQCVIVKNGWLKSFNKTTLAADGVLNLDADVFMASVAGGQSVVDPQIRYDRLSQRWYVVMIGIAYPNRLVLAVSNSSTITSSSSFTFYGVQQDLVTPVGNTGQLLDYPSLGVDSQALYVGGNMFPNGGAFAGVSLFIIRKSSVLAGGPMVISVFRNVANAPFAARGVDNDDPLSTEGYFVGTRQGATGQLALKRIFTPGGTPSMETVNRYITVPTTVGPQNVVTLGSTAPLSPVGDRTFYAMMERNPTTGTRTIWTSHNIEVDASGNANSAGNRNGMRWYELDNIAGTGAPTLRQSGTVYDSAATNPNSYWMGALSVNGQGHAVVGFSVAGPNTRAGIGFTGRHLNSALGTMEGMQALRTSTTNYNAQSGSSQRWGDYSMTSVDPDDNMTFWTTQMWCEAVNSYRVDMFKILAPPPATIVSCTPNEIVRGWTKNIVVTGSVVNGSGFFDPGAGFAKRIAAAFSGTGLTINSITYTSPTSLTLNVTASLVSPFGLRNLAVTNPDGQAVTGNGVLNVIDGNLLPTLASINPTTKRSKSGNFLMTLTGTDFVSSSVVRFNGTDVATNFINSGQLTATIPDSLIQSSGSFPVTVFSPAPGGGESNAISFTVTPTWIQGTITPQNYGPDPESLFAVIEIWGGEDMVATWSSFLGAGGTYQFLANIAPGTYDAYVRISPHWLVKKVSNFVVGEPTTVVVDAVLINGDVDGDNEVGPGDFAELSAAFGSTEGDPNFNSNAELDGDGEVGPSDFGILTSNFGISGDSP